MSSERPCALDGCDYQQRCDRIRRCILFEVDPQFEPERTNTMKRTTKPKAKRKARRTVYSTEPWDFAGQTRKATRSARTGKWVDNKSAASDPAGTVTETVNPPVAVLKQVVTEVKEILAAEELKPKTRVRRALDRIAAAWHYVGG